MPDATATAELGKLREARARAAAEVDDLEHKARAAAVAAQQVSAELAEAERVGVSAAKRSALESRLADARSLASEPWPERIAGRKARVRDCDAALRRHVQANLLELAGDIEGDGRAAVGAMTEAAENFVAAYSRREEVARQLGGLLSLTGPVRPEDVGPWSHAETVVREMTRWLAEGEPAPRLQRRPVQTEAPAGEAVLA
jgi:hypothetical protein